MKDHIKMFWLVWNDSRAMPAHKHFTENEAKAEAIRIARLQPGETVHVLSLTDSCAFNAVVWTKPERSG